MEMHELASIPPIVPAQPTNLHFGRLILLSIQSFLKMSELLILHRYLQRRSFTRTKTCKHGKLWAACLGLQPLLIARLKLCSADALRVILTQNVRVCGASHCSRSANHFPPPFMVQKDLTNFKDCCISSTSGRSCICSCRWTEMLDVDLDHPVRCLRCFFYIAPRTDKRKDR